MGSLMQGLQARKIAERNARIDEADAEMALDIAAERAMVEGRQGRRVQAAQAVAFAGGGVSGGTGTALQLAAQEAVNAQLRGSAELRAGQAEHSRKIQSAAMHRFRGRQARAAGILNFGMGGGFNPALNLANKGLNALKTRKADNILGRAGQTDLPNFSNMA